MDSAGKNIGKGLAIAGIWIGLATILFSPITSSVGIGAIAAAVVATATVCLYF